jgi:Zn-dependent M16 (insulinase) family peptidase
VGVQGALSADVPKVEAVIKQTFEKAAAQPFDAAHIESILHQIELSQKSQSTNFGLNVANAVFPTWTHGGVCFSFFRSFHLLRNRRCCFDDASQRSGVSVPR